jgi:hypothetical protein
MRRHINIKEINVIAGPGPTAITGEQVVDLHRTLVDRFEIVTPEVGTWKFECRRCRRRFPHRTPHKELIAHAAVCSMTSQENANMIPERVPRLTDASYISGQMFDKAVEEKFHNNPNDQAVMEQAINIIRMFRASKSHAQIIVDVSARSPLFRPRLQRNYR